jgi:hypothetical protein
MVAILPSRRTARSTVPPMPARSSWCVRSNGLRTVTPLAAVMMSPCVPLSAFAPRRPARSAGEPGRDPGDDDAVDPRRRQVIGRNDATRRGYPAVGNELGNGPAHGVDRNGKSQCGIGRIKPKVGADHPDQLPGRVEQRTSGIAGIDRRIGLNDVGDLWPLVVGS